MDQVRIESLDQFVGQEKMKRQLQVHISASVETQLPMRSTLLVGPPGFGKTSLATIIGDELGCEVLHLIMPKKLSIIERAVARHYGVLFLDELHNANRVTQEALLPLLELGHMQTASGRIIEPDEWLCVVGATTRLEKIIPALRDRFEIQPTFVDYTDDEMREIGRGMGRRAGVGFDDDELAILARASNGVPRQMRIFIETAQVMGVGDSRPPTAMDVLGFLNVDVDGLSAPHLGYMELLYENEMMGLSNIASILGIHSDAVAELERPLIRMGYVERTQRGRALTTLGSAKIRKGRKENRNKDGGRAWTVRPITP